MENHHEFHGKNHYKWSFSIAMLNYQRVGFDPAPSNLAIVLSKSNSRLDTVKMIRVDQIND